MYKNHVIHLKEQTLFKIYKYKKIKFHFKRILICILKKESIHAVRIILSLFKKHNNMENLILNQIKVMIYTIPILQIDLNVEK